MRYIQNISDVLADLHQLRIRNRAEFVSWWAIWTN